jgi:hypothetical protein
MKKLMLLVVSFAAPFTTSAQDKNPDAEGFRQVVLNATAVAVIYLVTVFVFKVLQAMHGYHLKNKLIERGIPEAITAQYLRQEESDTKDQPIKIFLVLAAAGIALLLIGYYEPSLVISLAIMSISISIAFLVYFFYLKRSKKIKK